ncbi:hypothetical protein LZ554_000794 [Drepanopeziza brunnea f. sp. 'monogermtubi']|nr:hypothetical protein LZ554_000794 [Drepanopeziza brunnea f. sp. 'monogermtubi']
MAWGANELTAKQRQSVKLLDKFKCRICEKWKEPASFSKKELNGYTWKVTNGTAVNGVSAKLRCRPCSGGPLQEKWCEGPCGKWKDLQKFSKSARSAGGNQWCQECTLWKLSNEPGVTAQAAPTGDLAPDEDEDYVAAGGHTAAGNYVDPEAGYDSDDDGYDWTYNAVGNDYEDSDFIPTQPAQPVTTTGTRQTTTTSKVTSGNRQTTVTSTTTTQVSTTASSTILGGPVPRDYIKLPYAPLAAALENMSLGSSTATSSQVMPATNVPPQLNGSRTVPDRHRPSWTVVGSSKIRARPGNTASPSVTNVARHDNSDDMSVSSVSNIYENAQSSVGSAWGPVDARRREQQQAVPFTGWDNRGNAHPQQRYQSSSEQTPSGSTMPSAASPVPAATRPDRPAPVPAHASPAPPRGDVAQTAAQASGYPDLHGLDWGPVAPITESRTGWNRAIGKKINIAYDAVKLRKDQAKSNPKPSPGNDDDGEDGLSDM